MGRGTVWGHGAHEGPGKTKALASHTMSVPYAGGGGPKRSGPMLNACIIYDWQGAGVGNAKRVNVRRMSGRTERLKEDLPAGDNNGSKIKIRSI